MVASLFGPGAAVNVNVSGTLVPQSFTAIAGQTLFNIVGWTYTPGTNSLLVFINGQKQVVGRDFTETSSSSFTLLEGCVVGDYVDVIGFPEVTLNATNVGSVIVGDSYTLGQYLSDSCINVKSYPYLAKGDGVTDDTAAINAAFLAARSSNPVKAVFAPAGTYLVGDLYFSPSTSGAENGAPAGLFGAGIRSTIFKAKAGTTTVLHSKNTTLRVFRDFWIDCDSKASSAIDTDWDYYVGPSINNVYENIRCENYVGIGWKMANNNDCKFTNILVVNPKTSGGVPRTGATAIDVQASGGMVTFDAVTTIGGYIDVGAQQLTLGPGCVTAGVRVKYAGSNFINLVGGYHYVNESNRLLIEIQGGLQAQSISLRETWLDTNGSTDTLIGGAGTALGYIDVSGYVATRADGSGSMRFIGAALTNGSGTLRTQVKAKITTAATINWAVDASKFHLVNDECLDAGFRVSDTLLTLFNSWVAYGAPYDGLKVRNMSGSKIRLFGVIKNGTLTAATKIAQLPVGQSPAQNKIFPASNANAYLNISVDTSGAITLANAAAVASFISIDAIIELES